MRQRRPGPKERPSPLHGTLSDLPIRVGNLTWPQWWRATLYTVIVLILMAAILAILSGSGDGFTDLLRLVRLL
jgi:hypothetical protein